MNLDALIQWIHLHPALGGLITFLISAAESIAIIGTIVPGSVMMTAIGTLIGSGILPLWSTLFFAILGAVAGDGVSYILGYTLKDKLQRLWPFSRYKKLLSTGEFFFVKHGAKSVLIGRFVGPVRAIVPLIAGSFGMRPVKFYIANIISAIGWAPAYLLPGYLLGAASLQLPPDIAIRAVLLLLIILFLVIFIPWVLQFIYQKIGRWLEYNLELLWQNMKAGPKRHYLTTWLRRVEGTRQYGQLGAAVLLLFLGLFFIFIAFNAAYQGPLTHWNMPVYYFLRSIRNPALDNIMVCFTFIGEKEVLLPCVAVLCIAYCLRGYWRIAWYFASLAILDSLLIAASKALTQTARPIGLMLQDSGTSFPSGHMAISIIFYGFLAILLTRFIQNTFVKKIIIWTVALLLLCIGFSRLYLGAHWLTDVIGGFTLGSFVLVFTRIRYYRYHQEHISPTFTFTVAFIALAVSWTVYCDKNFHAQIHNAQRVDRIHSVPLKTWWQGQEMKVPLFRTNRFNQPVELFSVEWASDLNTISDALQQKNWEAEPRFLWSDFLHPVKIAARLSDKRLFPTVFNGLAPTVTFIKHDTDRLLILRLWDSHTVLLPEDIPLWIGTLTDQEHDDDGVKQTNRETLEELIHSLQDVDWKLVTVNPEKLRLIHPDSAEAESLLLIKPQSA